MQNEDDVRGLAKTVEFIRAVSILFGIIHIYWYCYKRRILMLRSCHAPEFPEFF